MKTLVIVCAVAMLVTLPGLSAMAQMGGQPVSPPGAPQQPPAMGGGMMHQGMMGMMCPMMMGGGQMDPKVMGRMLQIRGEMLRAMGDILAKHGKLIEEGK